MAVAVEVFCVRHLYGGKKKDVGFDSMPVDWGRCFIDSETKSKWSGTVERVDCWWMGGLEWAKVAAAEK